jgi:hypothetical protein
MGAERKEEWEREKERKRKGSKIVGEVEGE